jgi:membrane protease YdiL (CAAX protease family)
MTGRQIALVLHALLLIGVLSVLVPVFTRWHPQLGYLLALSVYWLGFCLPVIAIHAWKRHDGRLFSERLAWRDWFVPLLLLAQVTLVALAGVVPHTAILTTNGAMLAAGTALINGPLEEVAWRGGFMTTFRDRPRLGFWLGWALFTAWHMPLALSHGIVFAGGWPALVGGAAVLGLLWSWIAWRTGSVFYVAIAHALTNALAFWVLYDSNGFV